MKPQILTRSEFQEAIVELDQTQPIGFDVETNAKEPWRHDSRIVGFSVAGTSLSTGQTVGFCVPLAHKIGINADPQILPEAVAFLGNSRIIPFYVQMEATWALAKWGIQPTFVGDAYIAGRMLQMKDAGLKDLTEKVLQRKTIRMEDFLPKDVFDFSEADPQAQIVIDYQIADAVNGVDLERQLAGKLRNSGMQAVYEIEIQTAVYLAYQSLAGYQVDLKRLDQELKSEEAAVAQLQKEIFGELKCEPFTINSPAQLGKALSGLGLVTPLKTEKGAPSWSQDAIEILIGRLLEDEANIPTANTLRKIITWKSRFAVSNSLRRRPSDVSADGRMHPNWKPIGFDGTSRIYAEGPSMTSFPKAARKALPAPPGMHWVKFDWKQAEVRILAHLSGDQALKDIFTSGEDYHSAVYARMSGCPIADVTPEQRESSKVITYSILYSGGNAYHVAQELGISQSAANRHVRAYFALFPQLGEFMSATRARAQQTRHVRTYLGRSRRLDGNDLGKIGDQACNSMGQQSCGTLLKIVLSRLLGTAEMLAPLLDGLCQVIPVFDAIFYCVNKSVPIEEHVEFVRSLVEMEIGDVKLEADFEMGDSWGETKPVQEYAQDGPVREIPESV